MGANTVFAAIVTYYPDLGGLNLLLESLYGQVQEVVIVDNASQGDELEAFFRQLPSQVSVLRNSTNMGLGAAVNQAVQWGVERGADYLLLLDQDSLLHQGMVHALRDGLQRASASGKVAAVGPCFIDSRTQQPAPFVRIGFPFNRKMWCSRNEIVECDFLITSGSLIPVAAFREVGGMDESLFIDNVDVEWCFRARSLGWRIYGVGAALMHHEIGDRIVTLPGGLGEVIVHSPTRLYYMMRNRLLLYRRRTTPWVWIAQDIPRLVLKFIRLALLVGPRVAHARYMLAGMRDGMRGVTGPLPRVQI